MFYFLVTLASADETLPKPLTDVEMPWMKSDFFRWAIIALILALLIYTIRRAFKSEVEITKEKHL